MPQKIQFHLINSFCGITNEKCFIEMPSSIFFQKIIPLSFIRDNKSLKFLKIIFNKMERSQILPPRPGISHRNIWFLISYDCGSIVVSNAPIGGLAAVVAFRIFKVCPIIVDLPLPRPATTFQYKLVNKRQFSIWFVSISICQEVLWELINFNQMKIFSIEVSIDSIN